jgi:hypothetical protein
MSAEIAVATISGKVYFQLVKELSIRHLDFVSLKPTDILPTGIRVVLTSLREKKCFAHKNVIAYEESDDPSEIVDEALMIIMGKIYFREWVVGVDPSETIGLALIGDGEILRTESRIVVEEAVNDILKFFDRFKSQRLVIRVGKGTAEYHRRFIKEIPSSKLPESIIELVDESGTTKTSKSRIRVIPLDEEATVRIARKQGEKVGE